MHEESSAVRLPSAEVRGAADAPAVMELSWELDSLIGCWFWFDNADPHLKKVYHGLIVGSPVAGYFLLKFDDADALPSGVHEIVSIERIASEAWSIFEREDELRAALSG